MNVDPIQIETMTNLPAMARQLAIPGMNGGNESMMCFLDGAGKERCFINNGKNVVNCSGNDCFVMYNTLNHKLLGKGKEIRNLGLDALMIPDGLSTRTVLVGNLPRNKVKSLKGIIGNDIPLEEIPELPSFMRGLPTPPTQCNINPLAAGCSAYLTSDDWVYVPVVGFKRRADVMKNPGTLFKGASIPGVKNIKNLLTAPFKKQQDHDTSDPGTP